MVFELGLTQLPGKGQKKPEFAVSGAPLISEHGPWSKCMWDLNFQTRDRTSVLCIGRQILNHWAAREIHFTSIFAFTNTERNFSN